MTERAAITDIVGAYEEYAALAGALGVRVNKGAVRRYALDKLGYRGEMKSFFSRSYAQRHPERTAPKAALEAVEALVCDLARTIHRGLGRRGRLSFRNGCVKRLMTAVGKLDAAKRGALSEEITRGRQAEFLRAQDRPIEDFHRALEEYAQGQTLARSRLIAHLRRELADRGLDMSRASIEERFRRNTKVRTVPPRLIAVVRELDGRFRTGLVEIETLTGEEPPGEWLEACREELGFRSKNAMHRALADSTSVHYETVHKALTNPRPGQRLQREIIDTMSAWREAVRRGERLPVSPEYLRGCSSEVPGLLRRLSRHSRSRREAMRSGARALGVGPGKMRRTMDGDGRDGRDFSQRGVRQLKELVKGREGHPHRPSYLIGVNARKMARLFARRAQAARDQWQLDPGNARLEKAFRRTRLQLIMAMKEGFATNDLEPDFDLVEIAD